MNLYEKEIKTTVCRLCGSDESHAFNGKDRFGEHSNTYELNRDMKALTGFAFNGESWARFFVPVRFCPYCGKELR